MSSDTNHPVSHHLLAGRFAARVDDIEPFRVMELLARAKQLEQEGRDVIHMEIGEPDFQTAAPIILAGQQALNDGKTQYTQALGIPELRQAISDWYRHRYGLAISPQRIVITPGGSGALLLLSALLVNAGEHLLLADPGYPCNRHFLRLVEGSGVLIPTGPDTRYQLSAELVKKHWTTKTRGALVASPANPTGEILEKNDLLALAEICRKQKGVLIVDEIYHGLTYDQPASSVLEVADDAYVINSFSKYFGMTGWRIGWMVAPESAISSIEKLAQNFYISVPTISQYAALAAFSPEAVAIHEERREAFARRRDYLIKALRELGFIIPHTPDGAFYLYADVSALCNDSRKFCHDLLEEEAVAVTPGEDFGHYRADQHVRFAYTTDISRLTEAVVRIQRFIARQSNR
jgi:aspartate/methionine/tyrosine aminotransferase